MIIQTSAIVLSSFPYGDNSLIAKCFSEDRGKIGIIIKGARNKKSSKVAHFQPLRYIDIIYNYKPTRELQVLSKVGFIEYWSNILNNLRSITLSMAILDMTEKAMLYDDPHPNLFLVLKKVLKDFNQNRYDQSVLFWFYECALLDNLGFRPNLKNNKMPGVILPDIQSGTNSLYILEKLFSGNIDKISMDSINNVDRKIISEYLWLLLKYHFDTIQKVKFREVIKTILSD